VFDLLDLLFRVIHHCPRLRSGVLAPTRVVSYAFSSSSHALVKRGFYLTERTQRRLRNARIDTASSLVFWPFRHLRQLRLQNTFLAFVAFLGTLLRSLRLFRIFMRPLSPLRWMEATLCA